VRKKRCSIKGAIRRNFLKSTFEAQTTDFFGLYPSKIIRYIITLDGTFWKLYTTRED